MVARRFSGVEIDCSGLLQAHLWQGTTNRGGTSMSVPRRNSRDNPYQHSPEFVPRSASLGLLGPPPAGSVAASASFLAAQNQKDTSSSFDSAFRLDTSDSPRSGGEARLQENRQLHASIADGMSAIMQERLQKVAVIECSAADPHNLKRHEITRKCAPCRRARTLCPWPAGATPLAWEPPCA